MVKPAKLDVDGDIHTGREIELLELVDRLGGGFDNVDEAFVRAGLKLLHGLLVHVRGAIHAELLDASRQRDGTGNPGAGALGGFDDFQSGLIDYAVIEALEFDTNALALHGSIKNEVGLSAGGCLRGGLNNLGENRCWNLLEVRRSDGGAGPALG